MLFKIIDSRAYVFKRGDVVGLFYLDKEGKIQFLPKGSFRPSCDDWEDAFNLLQMASSLTTTIRFPGLSITVNRVGRCAFATGDDGEFLGRYAIDDAGHVRYIGEKRLGAGAFLTVEGMIG